jgi:hypothetical protein
MNISYSIKTDNSRFVILGPSSAITSQPTPKRQCIYKHTYRSNAPFGPKVTLTTVAKTSTLEFNLSSAEFSLCCGRFNLSHLWSHARSRQQQIVPRGQTTCLFPVPMIIVRVIRRESIVYLVNHTAKTQWDVTSEFRLLSQLKIVATNQQPQLTCLNGQSKGERHPPALVYILCRIMFDGALSRWRMPHSSGIQQV